MRMAAPIAGFVLSCAIAGAQPSAGAQPPASAQPAAETLQYVIMRKGEQIGTHKFEFHRTGKETSVNIETNVEVKVLFVTAYRFQHVANERWVNERLVALDDDDNVAFGAHVGAGAAANSEALFLWNAASGLTQVAAVGASSGSTVTCW